MEPSIRPARTGDADSVARLVCELFAELAAPTPSRYDVATVAATARELLRDGGRGWAFLAEDRGEPFGVLTLSECEAMYAGGRFGEICELFVRPPFRSTTIGRRLIERAIDLARERRWTRLEVGAPDVPRWQRSVLFYERCGFAIVGPRLKLELGTRARQSR